MGSPAPSTPRAVTGASEEMKQDQPEAQPQGNMGGLGRSHRVQWKQTAGRCGTGWNQRGLAAGEGCQGQGWGAGLEGQGGRGAQGRKSLSGGVELSTYGANGGASLEKPPKEHRRSNLSSSRHLLETCLLSTIILPHLKMGVKKKKKWG